MSQKKDGSEVSSKSKARPSTGIGLPPPPGGVKIAPPPARTPTQSPAHKPQSNSGAAPGEWGEFASASQQQNAAAPAPASASNASWVQF